MAFVWNDDPNSATPPPIVPVPVGDGEMSFEQKEVANNVLVNTIYGAGTLLWNIATPPDAGDNGQFGDFDIVYALPTLNVKDIRVTHLEADNTTVYFNATINTANIGVATINTANIVNATIANGHMGVNPTANLQIATKEYVDALAANSAPQGGNLQLLIQAAGDLLVGVSDNTAERLPIGSTDRQVLIASSTSGNTGVRWAGPFGSARSHRGLTIGTNQDGILRNNQIVLVQCDEVVMDDGVRVTSGWNGLVADTAVSGAGGLDTGTVLPNTCYEVYAIRASTTGSQALLLHRAKDWHVDAQYAPTVGTNRNINFNYGPTQSVTINVAQRFVAQSNGPFVGIDLSLSRAGAPVGNVWVELQPNDITNNASGTILATSRKVSAGRIGNLAADIIRTRFIFDNSANVVAGNTYWAVTRTDYTRGDSQTNLNYLKIAGDAPSPGSPYQIGAAKFFNANTNGWAASNSAATIDGTQSSMNYYFRTFVEGNNSSIVMPTGYDEKCLISYCSTNFRSQLREYHQRVNKMSMSYHYSWNYLQNGGLSGGRAEAPGANNPASVAFSEPIHCGEFVPPVPCLLWVYKYTGLSGTAAVGMGNIACTEFPVQPLITEMDGSLTTSIGSAHIKFIGPIFVEYGCHTNHSGGSPFAALFVAGIEF